MPLTDERPIVIGIGEALFDCFKDNTNSQDDTNKREELGVAPLIFTYHAAKSHCKGVNETIKWKKRFS